MLNNLSTLIESKQLEVDGLELLQQASVMRTYGHQQIRLSLGGGQQGQLPTATPEGMPVSSIVKEAAHQFKGLTDLEIQSIRTEWHKFLSDPVVTAHMDKTEPAPLPPGTTLSVSQARQVQSRPADGEDYINAIAAHIKTLKPLFAKLINGVRWGAESLVDDPRQRTVTIAHAERYATDVFGGMELVLKNPGSLSEFEMGKLSTLRKRGAVDGLLGMAEALFEAEQETDPVKKAKLLEPGGKLDKYLEQAVRSDSAHSRVFASDHLDLTQMLDKLAGEIQAAGHADLALEVDKVTNSLDAQG